MTLGRDLWDMITTLINLDSLHKEFNTTTTILLETNNKIIDQIQSILQSKKVIIKISKQTTGDNIDNVVIVFRNKSILKKKQTVTMSAKTTISLATLEKTAHYLIES